jgi:hypothetical protein
LPGTTGYRVGAGTLSGEVEPRELLTREAGRAATRAPTRFPYALLVVAFTAPTVSPTPAC